jgi:hypothetical protein
VQTANKMGLQKKTGACVFVAAVKLLLSVYLATSKSKLLYDWQSVSQSVCLGIEYPCGTCGQILFPVGMLLSEVCGLVSVGRPLWREDGSVICSAITQWSESLRTRNHILLSHLKLLQPGGQVSVLISPRNRVAQLYPRALGSSNDRGIRIRWGRYSDL